MDCLRCRNLWCWRYESIRLGGGNKNVFFLKRILAALESARCIHVNVLAPFHGQDSLSIRLCLIVKTVAVVCFGWRERGREERGGEDRNQRLAALLLTLKSS